ncbi:MAG: hypothetical protein WCR49_15545, partial [Opitutae bacterium]
MQKLRFSHLFLVYGSWAVFTLGVKYIFVTGGVVSSLGKGLTAGALGALLEMRGLKVRIQKFDP